jgi:hypothetical protein
MLPPAIGLAVVGTRLEETFEKSPQPSQYEAIKLSIVQI